MQEPKLKVKAILLDLDGTILDSREAYLEAVRIAFAKLGQETFDAELGIQIPKRLEQGLPINDLLKGIDVQEFLEIYLRAYYQATSTKAKPISNVADTLKRLSEKAKLAITTMRYVPRKNVIDELEDFGLAKYFEYVVTALETRNPKPSPEALIICAKQLGVSTYECATVGDSVVDVRAGKNAETKTVAVLSGIFSLKELKMEKPDLILENVRELPGFLE